MLVHLLGYRVRLETDIDPLVPLDVNELIV